MVVNVTGSTATTATASTSYINGTPSSLGHDVLAQWKCNACHTAFHSSALQREHMKSQWHVYNLKRRVAELPPLDWEVFEEQMLPTVEAHRRSEEHDEDVPDIEGVEEDEDSEDQYTDFNSCFFCSYHVTLPPSVGDTEPSLTLLQHMRIAHSFFIPHLSSLTSLPSFLAYLATLVHTYHECLFCGVERGSKGAVQVHMRGRGHCRLHFVREPELWDFWEEGVQEMAGTMLSEGAEARVSSTGRERARDAAKKARAARMKRALLQSRSEQDVPTPTPSEAPSASPHETSGSLFGPQETLHNPPAAPTGTRQLSRRTEQGMLGIPLQQRHTLMAVEKGAQQGAQMRANAEAWSRERCANKQKHYRAAGPMRPNG